jgi:hypothetical protein
VYHRPMDDDVSPKTRPPGWGTTRETSFSEALRRERRFQAANPSSWKGKGKTKPPGIIR